MKKERGNQKSSAESLLYRLEDLQNGRDEMNLCELPFAALSGKRGRIAFTSAVKVRLFFANHAS